MQTADMAERNIEMLGQMFPNCLTETINADGKLVRAIDFDKLRQELACEVVEGAEERYQFTWPDKRAAIRLANAPTNKTLRPCREESVDFDNTENLYIEGDNLEVLKLLRENYLGKVKMIYIDPPYNTGNDFVYNDDFAQGKAEFEAQSGLFDEEGRRMADPMVQNTESNGRFHTDWLNMIYPRLKVAKDLLADDGVIVTLQNGIPEPGIADIIGKNRTMGCTVEWGAMLEGPGECVLTSEPDSLSFHMGKMDGITDAQFIKVKDLLEMMCPVHEEPNLIGARWSKLLINATFSGLGTVMGGVFGDVIDNKEAREIALRCMKECIDVGHASGVEFAPVPAITGIL